MLLLNPFAFADNFGDGSQTIPAVVYDGVQGYLKHTGGPAGAADGAALTVVWAGTFNSDGSAMTLLDIPGTVPVKLSRGSDNTITFAGGTAGAVFSNVTAAVAASLGFLIILASCNGTSSTLKVVHAGGTITGTNTPGSASSLDLTADWYLGADGGAAEFLDADTALWWADDQYIDFSVSSSREEFWDTTLHMLRDPGPDGSWPIGGPLPLDPPAIDLLAFSDRGASTTDNVTNDSAPQFSIDLPSGTQAGDIIHVYIDSVDTYQVTVTAGMIAGTDPVLFGATALSDGTYSIQMTIENADGESEKSTAVSITVDTSLGTVAASIAGDTTTDTTPDLSVDLSTSTLVAGNTLEVRASDGTVLASYTLLAGDISGGTATVTLSELALGSHTVTVYGYDGSGNLTAADEYTFEVVEDSFTIEGLFGVDDDGFYLDFQDLDTLFQDTAMTTPVTADGQDVAGISDKSGSGRNFIQGAVSSSPLVWNNATNDFARVGEVPGGNTRYIESASPFMYAAGACTVFAAIKGNPATNSWLIGEFNTGVDNPFYGILGSNTITSGTSREFIRNGAGASLSNAGLSAANTFDNTDNVVIVTDSGSLLTIYIDGASIDTQSYTRSGTLTLNTLAIGVAHITSVVGAFLCDLYGIGAIDRVLTSQEIADLTTALGAKMGRSL